MHRRKGECIKGFGEKRRRKDKYYGFDIISKYPVALIYTKIFSL
jgi:hypothetical protein